VKKLSAPESVEVRRLLFLLFTRTKSISVFSFEYCEAVEPVVVLEEVSVGCCVTKLGEFSNSKKRPIDSTGIIVAFSEANPVFWVVSSIVVSIVSVELSKVVSRKLSAGNSRVDVSGLRGEGDFPREFVVAYVLYTGEGSR
jgi:hypothetical protein